MTSTTRGEALDVLAELCELSPDVRLGQLLAHLGFLGEDQTGRSLWDIDDEQLLAVMYHHRTELVRRTEGAVPPSEDGLIAKLPAEGRKVYQELRSRVQTFGPDVEIYPTQKNLVFRAGWVFAEMRPQSKRANLRILVRPEGYNIPENDSRVFHGVTVTRVPDSYQWTVNHRFEVDADSPLEEVVKLLRQSYDAARRAQESKV